MPREPPTPLPHHLHAVLHLRTFVDLKSGINSFRYGGPRPIDEKKLDFQSAFLQIGATLGQNFMELRVGRHELEYGSGRLIDVREGPNVRLSFAESVDQPLSDFAFDHKPGFFDNYPNHGVSFWGVYATRALPQNSSLEIYYLGLDRKEATFQRGTVQEVRHSLGGRISRPLLPSRP